LPAADTEKAAKVNDARTYLSGSVHNDLDECAPYLSANAADFLAEKSLDLPIVDDNHITRPAGATSSGTRNADQLFSSLGPSSSYRRSTTTPQTASSIGQVKAIYKSMHVNPPGMRHVHSHKRGDRAPVPEELKII